MQEIEDFADNSEIARPSEEELLAERVRALIPGEQDNG